MTTRPCCDRPCLVTDSVKIRGRATFGHVCVNCRTFTPADGSRRVRLHRLPGKSGGGER